MEDCKWKMERWVQGECTKYNWPRLLKIVVDHSSKDI